MTLSYNYYIIYPNKQCPILRRIMPKEINSDLLRGNINTIILSALYSGDRYGYEIVSEIEQKSRGQFTIKQPTLYSCLKRLETQGFISSYWGEQSNGGRRKYFSLTELGKEVFKQSQDDYEYSRTVIDKLISENKYNLGNEEDSENAVVADTSSDSTVHIMSGNASVPEESITLSAQDESKTPQDLPEQLTLSDIDTCYSEPPSVFQDDMGDARFLPNDNIGNRLDEENKDGFMPYNNSEIHNNQPEQNKTEISWFDADIASENSLGGTNPILEKQEDIADIFNRNAGEQSYLDDIKTDNIKTEGIKNTSDLFDTFSDLTGDTASTKFNFEPNYSETEYPYADTSDNASAAIEAELSPLKKTERTEFFSYHDGETLNNAVTAADREIAEKANPINGYQDLLSGIIDKFGENGTEITKTDIENNALELNDKVQIRAFGNIVESARELGEEVVVRTNDNKSKHQYAVKYYYKDNLLRLVSSGILFVLMLAESLITYLICKNAFNAQGRYDTALFILSIIAALSLPVYAGFRYYSNPDSKKRIENNMIETFWFKLVVMVLICLLSFGLNLFMGMPLNGQINDYSVSLFLPIVLSTNFPLSYLIFKLMFNSKFFIAKD